uniref:Uncharacterized protein n=1 Tax=Parastrongyloides trichosuri TaxID=131310 RepID=A0A0N4Z8M7_PARTI
MKFIKKYLYFLLLCMYRMELISSLFTNHFQQYITKKYNESILKEFERKDILSGEGSFGGLNNENETSSRIPIIFIHGATGSGSTFKDIRAFFLNNGYINGDIYGITYGDNGLTPLFFVSFKCSDIKLIRRFILLVSNYRKSKVNILAYSMGVGLTRKAILGGKCVDTDEFLGARITTLVNTYVSLAGVSYGYEGCDKLSEIFLFCNPLNGMSCSSKFIKDINTPNFRYEGQKSYAIYSTNDLIVNQNCCENICSQLKYSNKNITTNEFDHYTIVNGTLLEYFNFFNHTTK